MRRSRGTSGNAGAAAAQRAVFPSAALCHPALPVPSQAIEWDGGGRDRAMRAVLSDRLASLQESQAATMHQLLSLRRDQLRLRVQQLSALRCLLRAEALRSETYTETQVGALSAHAWYPALCMVPSTAPCTVLDTAYPARYPLRYPACSVPSRDNPALATSALAPPLLQSLPSTATVASPPPSSGRHDAPGRRVAG